MVTLYEERPHLTLEQEKEKHLELVRKNFHFWQSEIKDWTARVNAAEMDDLFITSLRALNFAKRQLNLVLDELEKAHLSLI